MLRDHTAVITGATSGIGLGLAEAFAAAGCRLAVNGIESPAGGGATCSSPATPGGRGVVSSGRSSRSEPMRRADGMPQRSDSEPSTF